MRHVRNARGIAAEVDWAAVWPSVVELAEQGLSSRRIGARLGISHNAIIGYAHRNNLSHIWKTHARRNPPPPHTQHRPPRAASAKSAPVVGEPKAPLVDDEGRPITLESLSAAMCSFPIDNPGDPAFRYCGHKRRAKQDGGGPYCDEHAALCFQGKVKDAPRRESDAAPMVLKNAPWAM